MTQHLFRVVVRGMFADLDDDRRRRLVAEAPEHDIFLSSYTAAGTFTYEPRLEAFSFRYELRESGDDLGAAEAEAAVTERALGLAIDYLESHDIPHKRLRAIPTNMADFWRARD
ncbi:MAG: DUF6204 family protein [Acidimicrobiales bacterium]